MSKIDKNNKELIDGSIVDIHQTVNGQNYFVVLKTNPLDVRYYHDLNKKYEYDKEDLLSTFKYTDEVDWEIVGNVYDFKNISS